MSHYHYPILFCLKVSGGHQEEVHGVYIEHHQSYLLHHYLNASIQRRQTRMEQEQCRNFIAAVDRMIFIAICSGMWVNFCTLKQVISIKIYLKDTQYEDEVTNRQMWEKIFEDFYFLAHTFSQTNAKIDIALPIPRNINAKNKNIIYNKTKYFPLWQSEEFNITDTQKDKRTEHIFWKRELSPTTCT